MISYIFFIHFVGFIFLIFWFFLKQHLNESLNSCNFFFYFYFQESKNRNVNGIVVDVSSITTSYESYLNQFRMTVACNLSTLKTIVFKKIRFLQMQLSSVLCVLSWKHLMTKETGYGLKVNMCRHVKRVYKKNCWYLY